MAYFSTNLGLPSNPFTANADMQADIRSIHAALQGLQAALDSYTAPLAQDSSVWSAISPAQSLLTSNPNRLYGLATVAIPAGAMVSIFNNAGAMGFRLANSTGSIACRAFATRAIAAGQYGEVIVGQGIITGFSGLTPGTLFWLATTAGQIQNSAPGGGLIQKIGHSLDTTSIYFNPETY